MEMLTSPAGVQVTPSAEAAPEKVFPERERRTHAGAASEAPHERLQPWPVCARYCSVTPLDGVTTVMAKRESAFSDSRIITPDFAQPSVWSREATRAVMV